MRACKIRPKAGMPANEVRWLQKERKGVRLGYGDGASAKVQARRLNELVS